MNRGDGMKTWETPFIFPNGMIIKNRLVFAPISTMSSNALGQLSPEEIAFYHAHSQQVGIVILGSATISPSGKAYENNVSIAHDALIPNLKKYNRAIRTQGTKSIIQLYHGGQAIEYLAHHKKVPVVSPTTGAKYEVLTDQAIQNICEDFGKAMMRSLKAGFDGVEIHAGNPFLVQSFLSPRTNQRHDFWGNRTHFLEVLLRMAVEIRGQFAPSFIVGVRLAMAEKEAGGLTHDDTVAIVRKLSRLGFDYIHFNHDHLQTEMRSLQELQAAAGTIPVIGNGGIKTEYIIEETLKTVPLVSVARPLILNPHFPKAGEAKVLPKGLQASIASSPDWYKN